MLTVPDQSSCALHLSVRSHILHKTMYKIMRVLSIGIPREWSLPINDHIAMRQIQVYRDVTKIALWAGMPGPSSPGLTITSVCIPCLNAVI